MGQKAVLGNHRRRSIGVVEDLLTGILQERAFFGHSIPFVFSALWRDDDRLYSWMMQVRSATTLEDFVARALPVESKYATGEGK
jgi:hypothetical protein